MAEEGTRWSLQLDWRKANVVRTGIGPERTGWRCFLFLVWMLCLPVLIIAGRETSFLDRRLTNGRGGRKVRNVKNLGQFP